MLKVLAATYNTRARSRATLQEKDHASSGIEDGQEETVGLTQLQAVLAVHIPHRHVAAQPSGKNTGQDVQEGTVTG